jgi:zinc finger protein
MAESSSSMFQTVGAVAEHVEHAGETDAAAPTTQLAAGDMMALKSLCMGCGEDGVTNLLLITIPYFRNVIIMAFECEHCGLRNSEVQPAEVQEKGEARREVSSSRRQLSQRHFHSRRHCHHTTVVQAAHLS